MKSGRLLKFHRPGGEVHAYLYRDVGACRAALYVLAPGRRESPDATVQLSAAVESELERAVREWVDRRFPKDS